MNNTVNQIGNKRLVTLLAVASLILTAPLVAMQFTKEVNWTLSDFIIMGVLLYATTLACELVLRKVKTRRARLILCAAVLLAFLLIWAELAVGIFGTPFAGS